MNRSLKHFHFSRYSTLNQIESESEKLVIFSTLTTDLAHHNLPWQVDTFRIKNWFFFFLF